MPASLNNKTPGGRYNQLGGNREVRFFVNIEKRYFLLFITRLYFTNKRQEIKYFLPQMK